jgi:hypothetical protein
MAGVVATGVADSSIEELITRTRTMPPTMMRTPTTAMMAYSHQAYVSRRPGDRRADIVDLQAE